MKFDRKALREQAEAQKTAGREKFAAVANATPAAGVVIAAPKPTGDPDVDARLYREYRAQQTGNTAPAPAAAVNDPLDPLDQIAKAAELHRTGVLSDAEFSALKAKLLS